MQEIKLEPSFFFSTNYVPPKNKDVIDSLCGIMENERGVSEKSFSKLYEIRDESKSIIKKHEELIENGRSKNQRIKYIAEQIYDKEFNSKKEPEQSQQTSE